MIRFFLMSISFCFFVVCAQSGISHPKSAIPNPQSQIESAGSDSSHSRSGKKAILFLGNSLTAGYGFEVINAGLSGETSSGGLRRINWLLKREIDVLVLALGANDGLRGISPDVTAKNLEEILNRTREKYPHVKLVIAGMEAPPNMGQDFTAQFRAIFPGLAKKNKAALIPFLLEGVGGVAELNLADGIQASPEKRIIGSLDEWIIVFYNSPFITPLTYTPVNAYPIPLPLLDHDSGNGVVG
jgi:acyl-CoA thioesterase-1